MKKKSNTQETYVAVRLSSNKQMYQPSKRYLRWIDEHWYETADTPIYAFPESQIEQIGKWLVSHFHNHAAIVYPDGHEVVWSAFAEKKKAKPCMSFGCIKGFNFVLKKK